MKKGFTITELLVAVALLVAVMTISGVVFNYAIDAQRVSSAQTEIMRNFRVITGQLNADFESKCPGSYAAIGIDPNDDIGPYRADSIVFYITGDFQTMNLYDDKIVNGNVARVYYGQSLIADFNNPNAILARSQNILIPKDGVVPDTVGNIREREYEFTSILAQNKNYLADDANTINEWLTRPNINSTNEYHMYLAKGVSNFSVQAENGIDPNGTIDWWPNENDFPVNEGDFPSGTRAIKFKFTLYDSEGIIADGKRFEHIVYLKQ